MVIVQDGQPRAVIVTAAGPSPSAARAAAELKHYIERISGAGLPVYAGAATVPGRLEGHARLHVGRSEAVRALGVEPPAGHDREAGGEGFVLRTVGDRDLVLAGNEDAFYRGTEYAVYELLERLGCRWYFPGEFGQVLPELRTITVPDLDVEQKPSFVVRNIWMSGWADDSGDHPDWLVRNKGTLVRPFAFAGDGSIGRLAPPEIYEDVHPEIYAMGPDGQRRSRGPKGELHLTMLCVTNPLTIEIAVRTIKEYFRDHPEANSYGFSAPDWSPRCHCDVCVAADHAFDIDSGLEDSISDAYFNFVNNVAHEVNAEYPDRYIVILAYDNRVRPPEGLDRPWNRNIIVQLARLAVSALRPIPGGGDIYSRRHQRTIKAWARIAPKMVIYDYDPHATLNRMPFWNVHSIRANLPFYHEHGVVGFTTEGHNTFLRTGLNYYVRTRLMWDVGGRRGRPAWTTSTRALLRPRRGAHEGLLRPDRGPAGRLARARGLDLEAGRLDAHLPPGAHPGSGRASRPGGGARRHPPAAPAPRRLPGPARVHDDPQRHGDARPRGAVPRGPDSAGAAEPPHRGGRGDPARPAAPRAAVGGGLGQGPEHLAPLHRGPGGARRRRPRPAPGPGTRDRGVPHRPERRGPLRAVAPRRGGRGPGVEPHPRDHRLDAERLSR